MKSPIRHLPGILVAVGLAAGVVALSRVPYATGAAETSLIRFSWRARGQQVEECRPLTEEEKEHLPAHMRPSEICERRGLPYLLEVSLDDRTLLVDTVYPAGARGDRPVYVYREIAVSPGRHELRVRFAAVRAPETGPDRSEPGGLKGRDWLLERVVELDPGQILLITRSESDGKLEPRTAGHSEPQLQREDRGPSPQGPPYRPASSAVDRRAARPLAESLHPAPGDDHLIRSLSHRQVGTVARTRGGA